MFLIDIISVRPLTNRRLELSFENGLCTIIAIDNVIKSYTGIFAPLLNDDYFNQVKINSELGTIFWPNGADICPDVLYSVASKKPIIINSVTEYPAS